MILWRLCKLKYSSPEISLSGNGAKLTGGRWNESGLPVVYTSTSSSLALLEVLVNTDMRLLPKSLVAVCIEMPETAMIEERRLEELESDWYNDLDYCAGLGSEWLRSCRSLALRVPSACNPLEMNVLLNPAHPDIAGCSVGKPVLVHYDPRLLALFGGTKALH